MSDFRTCRVDSQVPRIREEQTRVGCCKCNSVRKSICVETYATNMVLVWYILIVSISYFIRTFNHITHRFFEPNLKPVKLRMHIFNQCHDIFNSVDIIIVKFFGNLDSTEIINRSPHRCSELGLRWVQSELCTQRRGLRTFRSPPPAITPLFVEEGKICAACVSTMRARSDMTFSARLGNFSALLAS